MWPALLSGLAAPAVPHQRRSGVILSAPHDSHSFQTTPVPLRDPRGTSTPDFLRPCPNIFLAGLRGWPGEVWSNFVRVLKSHFPTPLWERVTELTHDPLWGEGLIWKALLPRAEARTVRLPSATVSRSFRAESRLSVGVSVTPCVQHTDLWVKASRSDAGADKRAVSRSLLLRC